MSTIKEHFLFATKSGGSVVAWYDRSTRCWWAAKRDIHNNQIGDAIDTYSRSEIELEAVLRWGFCQFCGDSFVAKGGCACDREEGKKKIIIGYCTIHNR